MAGAEVTEGRGGGGRVGAQRVDQLVGELSELRRLREARGPHVAVHALVENVEHRVQARARRAQNTWGAANHGQRAG